MDGNCDWCGEPIGVSQPRVNAYRLDGPPGSRIDRDGELVAEFHADTCFEESRDYGWG